MESDESQTGVRVREVRLRCEGNFAYSYVERFGFTLDGPREQQLRAEDGQVHTPLFYILRVEKDSPAEHAGLKAGDGILQM